MIIVHSHHHIRWRIILTLAQPLIDSLLLVPTLLARKLLLLDDDAS